MRKSGQARVAAIGGAVAEVILAGVLLLAATSQAGRQTYGSLWILLVLVVALVINGLVLASLGLTALRGRATRWVTSLTLAIAAGGVVVVALVSIGSARDAATGGVGLSLITAAVGMDVLAAYLPRVK